MRDRETGNPSPAGEAARAILGDEWLLALEVRYGLAFAAADARLGLREPAPRGVLHADAQEVD